MHIGELSKASGVDIETIRYYEHEQLLRRPSRTETGYRDYGEDHLMELKLIRYCLSLPMPLTATKDLLDFRHDRNYLREEVDHLLQLYTEEIHEKIRQLHNMEKQVAALLYCRDQRRANIAIAAMQRQSQAVS